MANLSLGPAVTALRQKKSWGLERLAREAGIKTETLRALEHGTRAPRHSTVQAVADALGITSEQLHEEAAALLQPAPGSPLPSPKTIETQRISRLLDQRTKIAASRANVVRAGIAAPEITLQGGLYVPRGIENDTLQLLQETDSEIPLIVLEGEPGAGKSSLLWSLQGQLAAQAHIDAWLIDAVELTAVFGEDHHGLILSPEVTGFFVALRAAGRLPVLLIDTVDVALNTRDRAQYLIALLTELASAGVRVGVASRPGEARMLVSLDGRVMRLLEYSDEEFKVAVQHYAHAFVRASANTDVEQHAQALLEAAAQGYPIREICRNPLTLRMLYSVYAPEQINFIEVDIVSLYRAFWERRVKSDIRAEAPALPSSEIDLSRSAMRIALVMLVEGLPELPADMLARELETVGQPSKDLLTLEARGVIRISDYGSRRLAGFFHQTFFEHAAALGLLRLGRRVALRALADRWCAYRGNLFLGAALERVLVLAEFEPVPLREESEQILVDLLNQGPAGLSVLVYAFVHRDRIPKLAEEEIRRLIAAGDAVVIERLLSLAANATQSRRVALVEVLPGVIGTGDSRWMRRALDLLVRFAVPDVQTVAQALKTTGLSQLLIEGADKYPQVRDLYLEFLGRYLQRDPEWVLDQLAAIFADCLKRRADDTAFQVLSIVRKHGSAYPNLASIFETKAGLNRREAEDILTAEAVAQEFGELFYAEWRARQMDVGAVMSALKAEWYRGLSLTARLNGLVHIILSLRPPEVVDAFRMSADIDDPTVRAMLARITWTKVMPAITDAWEAQEAEELLRSIAALCTDIFETSRNYAADIAYHVIAHGPFRLELARLLLGEPTLSQAGPWLRTDALGRRLIESHVAGILGARKAMAELIAAPEQHRQLAQSALAQMRFVQATPAMIDTGMELAVRTGNVEAVTGFLQRTTAPCPQWGTHVSSFTKMAEKLRASGNAKTRRQAIALELEVTRLRLDDSLDCPRLIHLLEHETDDANQALLIRALGHLIKGDGAWDAARLAWLIGFGDGKGLNARTAILEIVAVASEECDPAIAAHADALFELAFQGKTDGNIIALLQTPIFVLFRRNDARVPIFAEALITRCARLPTQTCRRVCAKFRNLFTLIMRRMDVEMKNKLLAAVPGLDRYLARMIIQGAGESNTPDFAEKLKAIAENPNTKAEIVTLAGRFLRRELRVSGLERWPELYELVGG